MDVERKFTRVKRIAPLVYSASTSPYMFMERFVLPPFSVSINRIKIKDLPQSPLLAEFLGL